MSVEHFGGLLDVRDLRDVDRNYSPGPCENVVDLCAGQILSRPGTSTFFDMGGGTSISHMEKFIRVDGSRYLFALMDDGKIYWTTTGAVRALLMTPSPAIDLFKTKTYGNRAYIFLSASGNGSQEPKIWDTTNLDPMTVTGSSIGTFAAADGAAGSVTVGDHKLWVIFETRAGFRINTRSGGTDGKITYTAPGAKKISLTNIPVHADASVTKRHIAMTAASLERGYIALTISDNSTTTGTIDIADEQLVNQTNVDDYAQYSQPAPSAINGIVYHDRMVLVAGGGSRVYVSEIGQPTSFRSDVGFIDVDVDTGSGGVNGCFIIRDMLYLQKAKKLYVAQDNGDHPSTWPVYLVSESLGSVSASGIDSDAAEQFAAVMDFKGLYIFDGGRPEELSWPIKTTWATQNYGNMHKAKLTIDPLNRLIYCFMPLGASTTPDIILVCDYKNGASRDRVRWSKWTTAGTAWKGLLTDFDGNANVPVLVYDASAIIKKFDSAAFTDGGTAIAWKYRFGYFELAETGLHLFAGLEMKALGGGTLNLEIFGPDGTSLLTPAAITLAATPNKDIRRLFHVFKERIYLELSQTSLSARFKLNRLTVYARPLGMRSHAS